MVETQSRNPTEQKELTMSIKKVEAAPSSTPLTRGLAKPALLALADGRIE